MSCRIRARRNEGYRTEDSYYGSWVTKSYEFRQWFKGSKVVDDRGHPLVVYHGSETGGFSVFSTKTVNKMFGNKPAYLFFTNNWEIARSYSPSDVLDPMPPHMRVENDKDLRDLIAREARRLGVSIDFSSFKRLVYDPERREEQWYSVTADNRYFGEGSSGESGRYSEEAWPAARRELIYAMGRNFDTRTKYLPGIYAVYLRIVNPLVVDAEGAKWTAIPFRGAFASTDDICTTALEEGHDGVIIRNAVDMGQYAPRGVQIPATIYAVFDPRQVKSAYRNVGTFDENSPDIRENPRRKRKARKAAKPHGQESLPFLSPKQKAEWLEQYGQYMEARDLYEQMLEKAYRNPRRARRNPAKMGPLIKLFGKLKYRVVDESEAFQVVLYDGQKRIGQIQMFRAGPRKVTELRPYCVPMLEELGFSVAGLSEDKYRASSPHYPRVWEVYNVALADEAKGQGFGKLIYEVAMREAYHRVGAWTGEPGPYFLIPNFCSGAGSTSDEAKRVWKSLAREWPSRTTTWTNGFTFTVLHVGHEPVVHEPKAYKAAANPRRPNWRGATQVQSLLFDKALFAPSEARRWAKKHNFVATGLDAGSDAATYLRIRQADPSAFRKVTMRTIELTDRIKAVIGVPVGAPTKQR